MLLQQTKGIIVHINAELLCVMGWRSGGGHKIDM
jgi:hypothetical protein